MLNYEQFKHFYTVPTSSITEEEEKQIREYRQSIIDTIAVEGRDSLDELLREVDSLLTDIGVARAEMHAEREYAELYAYDEEEPWWCR